LGGRGIRDEAVFFMPGKIPDCGGERNATGMIPGMLPKQRCEVDGPRFLRRRIDRRKAAIRRQLLQVRDIPGDAAPSRRHVR